MTDPTVQHELLVRIIGHAREQAAVIAPGRAIQIEICARPPIWPVLPAGLGKGAGEKSALNSVDIALRSKEGDALQVQELDRRIVLRRGELRVVVAVAWAPVSNRNTTLDHLREALSFGIANKLINSQVMGAALENDNVIASLIEQAEASPKPGHYSLVARVHDRDGAGKPRVLESAPLDFQILGLREEDTTLARQEEPVGKRPSGGSAPAAGREEKETGWSPAWPSSRQRHAEGPAFRAPATALAERTDELVERLVGVGANPVGLDVGTSNIVVARRDGKEIYSESQPSAFIPVPYSPITESTIRAQPEISYFRVGDQLIIHGSVTERFANMFNAELLRPMSGGVLSGGDTAANTVIRRILQTMVPKARRRGEILSFSVPAVTLGREADLIYHEAALREYITLLGYRAVAVNEGLAVVFAELEEQNFTGIGISCGGGMCNATLAFLSIPSIMISIPKGGDFIDASVGAVVGERATRVKMLKEAGIDLSRSPKDKVEKALHIYYEDLVETLVDALRERISKADKLPRTDRPLPIVLSGGTAKARGFRELFERILRARSLPIEIAEIRLASDPLTATARGALICAMYEK